MKKAKPIIHDGCHITDYRNFFEWWYFDFDLQSQRHIYIEWHAPNFVTRDAFCLLIVRIHDNENAQYEHYTTKSFRYHRSAVAQKETSCDIVFPAGRIWERNGDYFINVKEKNLAIDLELKRLLPPVIAEDGVVHRARDNDEFFCWIIPLPRAKVTGEIQFDDKRIEAKGIAYHDHNWGNLHIGRHLRGWIWLRVFFDDFTLIFADITSKNHRGNSQIVLFIDKHGEKIDISLLQVEYINHSSHNRYKLSIPHGILISLNNGEKYRIKLKIVKNISGQEFPLGSFDNHLWNSFFTKAYYLCKLNYAPDFIKKLFGRSLYFQFAASGELYVDGNLIDAGNGNAEVFSFGT